MIFTEDLSRPEGPTLLPDGSWVCVEMGPERGCVTQISADGRTKRVIAKTGRPNGLALDREGVLWVAESINPPSLLRMTLDGQYEVFMTECGGEPFLFPNDLCFGPDGALYVTDSGIPFPEWAGRRADYRGVPTDGRVYRIDLQTRQATRLDRGLRFTNGLVFGPDDSLYVNETITGNLFRYPWVDGHIVARREFVTNVIAPDAPDVYKGPDGMALGRDGRLYVTVFGQGDVTVLEPDGTLVRRLPLEGKMPTNVAFGPPGERRLYVTEQGIGRIEMLEVETEGWPLYSSLPRPTPEEERA
jgi:gluconolactonase